MKKLLASLLLTAISVAPMAAAATSPKGESVLPEEEGIYEVPGKSHLRLRVFVYRAKPARPATAPTLACVQDPDSLATPTSAGWTLPITWTYRLNPSSVPSTVGTGNLAAIAANAYGQWDDILSAVSFMRGDDTTVNRAVMDGQNVVSWGRTSASALAVTYTWYDQTTRKALEIDTIMNGKFKWYWANPATNVCIGGPSAYQGVYDAQDILTHELGHTVGLNDHYTAAYTHNTMYGYGSTGETKKNTLTSGDIVGAQTLY